MRRFLTGLAVALLTTAPAIAQNFPNEFGLCQAASGSTLNPTFCIEESTGDIELNETVNIKSLELATVAVTATGTELNLIDGVTASTAELNLNDGQTATAAEVNKTDGIAATAYLAVSDGCSFTEDGSGTAYTCTVEIPAGAFLLNIQFVSTVLWDGTSASLIIGDDDDPNGWFEATNLKATDLLVGEVLDISNAENWGGKQGAYLVAATGRKGRVTAGVDSGIYYGAASEVIFLVTPGAADGSAGRSFGLVTYVVPTLTASTNS
jgi:hypothetical protein